MARKKKNPGLLGWAVIAGLGYVAYSQLKGKKDKAAQARPRLPFASYVPANLQNPYSPSDGSGA